MDSGTVKVAQSKCAELKKDEARKFAVAYAELPEKYHGYLAAFPQKTLIMYKELAEDELKVLRDEYGWGNVSAYKGKTFFTTQLPYLGVDGCLAEFEDFNKDRVTSIDTSFVVVEGQLMAKAVVTSDRSSRTGWAEVGKDDEGNPNKLDIQVVNAVRKALSLFGFGRFGIDKTEYGGSRLVEEFLAFKKSQQKSKE